MTEQQETTKKEKIKICPKCVEEFPFNEDFLPSNKSKNEILICVVCHRQEDKKREKERN
ncbi:MAG: hypothetical protein ABH956_01215 [Candidatus Nealsonbacteria bacterium]